MRLLVQRVKEAKVTVDSTITGAIGAGLLVFLAVHKDDTEDDIPWLVRKLIGLRIFHDDQKKMNLSVQEIKGGILVVSQFTLYGKCRNGKRPDFIQSASGEKAEKLYDHFVTDLKKTYTNVETGRFAAYMDVALINDGPVTLIIDGK